MPGANSRDLQFVLNHYIQGVVCVYLLIGPGGEYVGQTNDLPNRLRQHAKADGDCSYLYRAIRKHGWEAFRVEVLHTNLTRDEANALEALEIEQRGTLAPHGYNLMSGGGAFNHRPSTKEKIRQAHLGKPKPKPSKETLAKRSEGLKAAWARRHKEGPVAYSMTGRKHSAETKAKMRASRLRLNARLREERESQ